MLHYSKYNKGYSLKEFVEKIVFKFTVDPKLVSNEKQKSWFMICPKWVNLWPCGGYVCKHPFIPINPESDPTAVKKPRNF